MNATRTETKIEKPMPDKMRAPQMKEDHVICFVCRGFVQMKDTIELDHSSGRFKVRVCLKHLEV